MTQPCSEDQGAGPWCAENAHEVSLVLRRDRLTCQGTTRAPWERTRCNPRFSVQGVHLQGYLDRRTHSWRSQISHNNESLCCDLHFVPPSLVVCVCCDRADWNQWLVLICSRNSPRWKERNPKLELIAHVRKAKSEKRLLWTAEETQHQTRKYSWRGAPCDDWIRVSAEKATPRGVQKSRSAARETWSSKNNNLLVHYW